MTYPPPTGSPVTLRYFAWVRERIGLSEERLALPDTIETVAELMVWLTQRGPGYAAAFAEGSAVRAAIDQRAVRPTEPLGQAREIAFFPPVTGG